MSRVTFTWRGDQFERLVDRAVRKGLSDAAMVLADGVVRIFGVNHGGVPSQPGEPPNSQTGHLRNSVAFVTANQDWQAFVGSNVPYARYLNFGTTRIEPRPWAVPALNRSRARMQRVFASSAAAVMKGGAL